MTDLAAWLLDRIAEDEAVARAATPGPWVDTGTVLAGVSTPEYRTVAECNSTHWYVGDEDYSYPAEPEEAANAAHIARWDPARVLAECQAKRAIIRLHQSWPVLVEQSPKFEQGDDLSTVTMRLTRQIAWLTQQEYRERFGYEPPTTPILRAMAAVYADRDGYDPAWAVE